ncbi:MAG: DUF6268 family outer membrane beta-barrel protein [Bacteroidota bacterium]
MKKSFLTSLPLLLLLNTATSQGLDVFYFGTSFYPKRALNTNDSTEVSLLEYQFKFNVLQKFENDSSKFLIHGVRYDRFIPTIHRTSDDQRTQLHSFMYSLTWFKKINKKWNLSLTGVPTLSSQFEAPISGQDFLFQGTALAINKKSDSKQLGYGIVYTSRLGRQIVVPMFLYRITKASMSLNLILPFRAVIEFRKADKSLRYGFNANLNGGVFNFNDRNAANSAFIDEVGFSRAVIGTFLAYKISGPFYLNAGAGMAVARTFQFIDESDNILEDLTQKPGPYINLALSMTFL